MKAKGVSLIPYPTWVLISPVPTAFPVMALTMHSPCPGEDSPEATEKCVRLQEEAHTRLVAKVEIEDRSHGEVDQLEPGSTWTSIDNLCDAVLELREIVQIGRCAADTPIQPFQVGQAASTRHRCRVCC